MINTVAPKCKPLLNFNKLYYSELKHASEITFYRFNKSQDAAVWV